MSITYGAYLDKFKECSDRPLAGVLTLFIMIVSFEIFIGWLRYMETPPEYIMGIVLICVMSFGGAILIVLIGLYAWLTLCYIIYRTTSIDLVTRRYGAPLYILYIIIRAVSFVNLTPLYK